MTQAGDTKSRDEKLKLVYAMIKESGGAHDYVISFFADLLAHIEKLESALFIGMAKQEKAYFRLQKGFFNPLDIHNQAWRKAEDRMFNAIVELIQVAKNGADESLIIGIDLQEKTHSKRSGKAGAAKRHAPMRELKAWMLQRYSEGKWPSANKAAFDLKESVIKHGKTINAHLSEENAQRTIADWIRAQPKPKT